MVDRDWALEIRPPFGVSGRGALPREGWGRGGACRSDRGQLHEALQVLGGGGEEEFFGCAREPSEPQAPQLEMPLQMREQHLDLFPPRPRNGVSGGAGQIPDALPRRL